MCHRCFEELMSLGAYRCKVCNELIQAFNQDTLENAVFVHQEVKGHDEFKYVTRAELERIDLKAKA